MLQILRQANRTPGYDSRNLNDIFGKMINKSLLEKNNFQDNLSLLGAICKLCFKPLYIEKVESYLMTTLLGNRDHIVERPSILADYFNSYKDRKKVSQT